MAVRKEPQHLLCDGTGDKPADVPLLKDQTLCGRNSSQSPYRHMQHKNKSTPCPNFRRQLFGRSSETKE